jgi:hypothetical protein
MSDKTNNTIWLGKGSAPRYASVPIPFPLLTMVSDEVPNDILSGGLVDYIFYSLAFMPAARGVLSCGRKWHSQNYTALYPPLAPLPDTVSTTLREKSLTR